MVNSNPLSFSKVISELMKVDIGHFETLQDSICRVLFSSIPCLKLISLLTYNKYTNQLVYRAVHFDNSIFDISKITHLIKDQIILDVDNCASGKLIKTNNNPIIILQNVLLDKDYQSRALAQMLGLKKSIMLRLSDLRIKEVYGVLIIYPTDTSPLNNASTQQLTLLISCIENIISNAKSIKENTILWEIIEAAKKVSKNLNSFLYKCVVIISNHLSVRGCSIFILDPLDNKVKLAATQGIKPGPSRAHLYVNKRFTKEEVYYELGENKTGAIVRDNTIMFRNSFDTSQSKWMESCDNGPYVGVPIPNSIEEKGANKAIGVIRCTTKPNTLLGSKIEAFNQDDIELLTYIAHLISVFIELAFHQTLQRQILTRMPHEIRASIGNIISICDYLEHLYNRVVNEDRISKKIETKLEDLRDECSLSLMTVNSLVAFEDNYEAYEFELTDLFVDIVAKVRKMLDPTAIKEKNIKIVYNNMIGMPKLYVDRKRLQLVFHNLLLNAIKYSWSNSDKSENRDILIQSDKTSDNAYYTISVSNYGISIPEHKTNDIFIYGVRTLEAIDVDPSGMGFGLALTKQIILLHNSKIEVTGLSNPTVFTIFFPKHLTTKKPYPQTREVINDSND